MKELFPYYTIAHFVNRPSVPTEFEIVRFDAMEEPEVDDIHKHTFYEILWVEEGVSRQTIDYVEYEVLPNSLFFISPNQVHQFGEWQGLKGGTIFFTADFFQLHQNNQDKLLELSFLDNFFAHPCLQLPEHVFAELKQTIDLMYREHRRPDRNPQIAQALLGVLLNQVQRCVDARAGHAVSKKYLILYKRFRLLLEKHFFENQTAAFFAAQLHITAHHLNLICKQVTNRTASEVIRARSILEAKRMITYTDYSVTEIATELNYFDSSYFSKLFKAETNQTPTEFKAEMSEKYRKR